MASREAFALIARTALRVVLIVAMYRVVASVHQHAWSQSHQDLGCVGICETDRPWHCGWAYSQEFPAEFSRAAMVLLGGALCVSVLGTHGLPRAARLRRAAALAAVAYLVICPLNAALSDWHGDWPVFYEVPLALASFPLNLLAVPFLPSDKGVRFPYLGGDPHLWEIQHHPRRAPAYARRLRILTVVRGGALVETPLPPVEDESGDVETPLRVTPTPAHAGYRSRAAGRQQFHLEVGRSLQVEVTWSAAVVMRDDAPGSVAHRRSCARPVGASPAGARAMPSRGPRDDLWPWLAVGREHDARRDRGLRCRAPPEAVACVPAPGVLLELRPDVGGGYGVERQRPALAVDVQRRGHRTSALQTDGLGARPRGAGSRCGSRPAPRPARRPARAGPRWSGCSRRSRCRWRRAGHRGPAEAWPGGGRPRGPPCPGSGGARPGPGRHRGQRWTPRPRGAGWSAPGAGCGPVPWSARSA